LYGHNVTLTDGDMWASCALSTFTRWC